MADDVMVNGNTQEVSATTNYSQWVIFLTLFIRFLSRTKQKSIQDLTKYEASKLSSNLVRFPYPYTVHINEPDMSMGNEIRFYSHCKMSDGPE